jgi:hypothetical protein
MAVMNVFKTTTTAESPLDASTGTEAKPTVSDSNRLRTSPR